VTVVDLVLMRRGGTAWALPHADVQGFVPRAGGIAIAFSGATVLADQVQGVARQVRLRPVGIILRRYWKRSCLGTALVDGMPVIVIDPGAPPEELLLSMGEADEH
jgi:hypothetical protein